MITDLLATVATISGSAVSAIAFIQAWKIIKRKSAADLSITLFAAFEINLIIWWIYGLSILNYPILIANTIGLIASTLILVLCFKYREKKKNKKKRMVKK